jgi:hypothetical protein
VPGVAAATGCRRHEALRQGRAGALPLRRCRSAASCRRRGAGVPSGGGAREMFASFHGAEEETQGLLGKTAAPAGSERGSEGSGVACCCCGGAARRTGRSGELKCAEPGEAAPGCSVCESPPHRLALSYYAALPGFEYLSLYLWLLKDFSWSQLWLWSAITWGGLALLLIIALLLKTLHRRRWAQAYVSFGALLWLLGNYVWLVGDVLLLAVAEPHPDPACLAWTRGLLTTASVWLSLYFLVLLPFNLLPAAEPAGGALLSSSPPSSSSSKSESSSAAAASSSAAVGGAGATEAEAEAGGELLEENETPSPAPRMRQYFHTFSEYETLHVLLWTFKDLWWVWDMPWLCLATVVVVILLSVDLCYLLATHAGQFVEFWHSVVLLIWVIANATWALGEMLIENPTLEAGSDTWSATLGNYALVSRTTQSTLLTFRRVVGWTFFSDLAIVVLFYVYWVSLSLAPGRLPGYQEYKRERRHNLEQLRRASLAGGEPARARAGHPPEPDLSQV